MSQMGQASKVFLTLWNTTQKLCSLGDTATGCKHTYNQTVTSLPVCKFGAGQVVYRRALWMYVYLRVDAIFPMTNIPSTGNSISVWLLGVILAASILMCACEVSWSKPKLDGENVWVFSSLLLILLCAIFQCDGQAWTCRACVRLCIVNYAV